MALKYAVDTLDDVPEAARGFYAEKDGKHVLAVDGVVPKARLDEFRETNITTRRELDEMRTRFDGIDPDEARKLADSARKQRDGQLLSAGKVDELVNERVGAMKTEFEKQTKALNGERDGMKRQLEGLLVDGAIRDAATKAGVRNTAIDDVLLRGRQVFRLHEGKAAAFEGDKPAYGRDGEPMQIGEWIGGLVDRAPHLFESSTGGGAKGAQAGSGATAGRLSRDDHAGFLKNLDAISSGKIKVE